MTVPVCPIHGAPMKPSNSGSGFFCSKKLDSGKYCGHTADSPATKPPGRGPAGLSDEMVGAVTAHKRYIVALEFASSVYRGVGPEMSDEALAFARRVYESFPNE